MEHGVEQQAGPMVLVKRLFRSNNKPRTIRAILDEIPVLTPAQVSMAVTLMQKQRWLTRQLVPSIKRGRKECYEYTYHDVKLPRVRNANPTD